MKLVVYGQNDINYLEEMAQDLFNNIKNKN